MVGAVELLDALTRQEGERLWTAVEAAVADPDYPLPRTLVTVAGVIALELTHAAPEKRRKFADDHMSDLGKGEVTEDGVLDYTSADFAIQVLREYAKR